MASALNNLLAWPRRGQARENQQGVRTCAHFNDRNIMDHRSPASNGPAERSLREREEENLRQRGRQQRRERNTACSYRGKTKTGELAGQTGHWDRGWSLKRREGWLIKDYITVWKLRWRNEFERFQKSQTVISAGRLFQRRKRPCCQLTLYSETVMPKVGCEV